MSKFAKKLLPLGTFFQTIENKNTFYHPVILNIMRLMFQLYNSIFIGIKNRNSINIISLKFFFISLQKGSKWEAANYFECFEFLFCLLKISIGKQFALKCFRKNSCNFLLMHSMQNNIQIISLFRNTLNFMQSMHVKTFSLVFSLVFIQRLELGL